MLPYTPLHALLVQAVGNIPLVMTSGNKSDEPIAYLDDDAFERLRDIADIFLIHDRPIHIRCDDSIVRVIGDEQTLIRRSRGYAPEPLELPIKCSIPTLAVGGQLKGAFALGIERHAIISHHLGDLDHCAAFQAFERDEKLYEELFRITPERIIHDLHPDYASTRYAQFRAQSDGIECLAVQHHHAHIASCMAENGLNQPVIGVAFDGTGFGEYGASGLKDEYCSGELAIWGGEFLVGDYRGFRRAARLRYVGMPSGQVAIREPWRMAASHLLDADLDTSTLAQQHGTGPLRIIRTILERRFNSPATSSVGRLFDAVSSLIGIRDRMSYEGQAAAELEQHAENQPAEITYPFEIVTSSNDAMPTDQCLIIDTRPLIRAVHEERCRGTAIAIVARRFHFTLAHIVLRTCQVLRQQTEIETVALSGGVFMNRIFTEDTVHLLQDEHFRVVRHRRVPPNDGGLSLGQLAIAACS